MSKVSVRRLAFTDMDDEREAVARHFRDYEDELDEEAVGNADPRNLLAFTGKYIDATSEQATSTYAPWIMANIDERRLPESVERRIGERVEQFLEFSAEFNASLTNALVATVLYNHKPAAQAQVLKGALDRAVSSFVECLMREIDSISDLIARMERRVYKEGAPGFEYGPRKSIKEFAHDARRALYNLPANLLRDEESAIHGIGVALSPFAAYVSRWARTQYTRFVRTVHDCARHCLKMVNEQRHHMKFVSSVRAVFDDESPQAKLLRRFKEERAGFMREIEKSLQEAISRGVPLPRLGASWLAYAHVIPHMLMKYHSVMLHLQNRGHPPLVAPKKRHVIYDTGDQADAEDYYGVYDGRVYRNAPGMQELYVVMPDGTERGQNEEDRAHRARQNQRTRRWFD